MPLGQEAPKVRTYSNVVAKHAAVIIQEQQSLVGSHRHSRWLIAWSYGAAQLKERKSNCLRRNIHCCKPLVKNTVIPAVAHDPALPPPPWATEHAHRWRDATRAEHDDGEEPLFVMATNRIRVAYP